MEDKRKSNGNVATWTGGRVERRSEEWTDEQEGVAVARLARRGQSAASGGSCETSRQEVGVTLSAGSAANTSRVMAHGVHEVWFGPQPLGKTKKSSKAARPDGKGVGSRRIFSPIFKLQVLDSYRQDADCQGNQRATARKYGIHRRQIQKWLQMENNLRLSVQQSNSTAALNLSFTKVTDDVDLAGAPSPVSTTSKISSVSSADSKENSSADEEYINVDEVSDIEDDRVSWCFDEKLDEALDFTRATLSKRKFYTSDFKLHVLDAFKNDYSCKGNQRATARKFGIHRRQVQKWLNQDSEGCLDLSGTKRKSESDTYLPDAKRKSPESFESVQESALCLVKKKIDPGMVEKPAQQGVFFEPSTVHYQGSSLCYGNIPSDYPAYCLCPSWNCCYQQISPLRAPIFENPPKYTCSLDLKFSNYESSYVDIPLQYGFGESVLPKWLKDSTTCPSRLYLHQQHSNVQLLSSYR